MLQSITLSFLAPKNFTAITKRLISWQPSLIARSFHNTLRCYNSSHMPSSNLEDQRRKHSYIAAEEKKEEELIQEENDDQRAQNSFEQEMHEDMRQRNEELLQRQQNQADLKRRIEIKRTLIHAMQDRLRNNMTIGGKRVPIRYALDKLLMCRLGDAPSHSQYASHRNDIVLRFTMDLAIEKVKGRCYCDSARVDGFDWELWWEVIDLEEESRMLELGHTSSARRQRKTFLGKGLKNTSTDFQQLSQNKTP